MSLSSDAEGTHRQQTSLEHGEPLETQAGSEPSSTEEEFSDSDTSLSATDSPEGNESDYPSDLLFALQPNDLLDVPQELQSVFIVLHEERLIYGDDRFNVRAIFSNRVDANNQVLEIFEEHHSEYRDYEFLEDFRDGIGECEVRWYIDEWGCLSLTGMDKIDEEGQDYRRRFDKTQKVGDSFRVYVVRQRVQ